MDLLAATTTNTPWWETVLISLGGAVIALLGVVLNSCLADRREARKDAARERAEVMAADRAALAGLIAALHPWQAALDYVLLGLVYRHHSPTKKVRAEVYEKATHDSERFAAALWNARLTVQNPYARATLDELMTAHQDLTKLVEAYGEDASKADEVEARRARLGTDINRFCETLEVATICWDGSVPDRSNIEKPET